MITRRNVTSKMTASLRLIPLSPKECSSLLKARGKFLIPGNCIPVPAESERDARNTITLKLCSRSDDVIDLDLDDDDDVDDDDGTPSHHPTVYARKYDDDNIVATTVLGRQKFTGIKCVAISRALCDVSLYEGKSRSSMSSPFASMRMRKPPNTTTSEGTSTDGGDNGKNENDNSNHHHRVHLDGELVNAALGEEVPLSDGSIISLYGEVGFAYRVSIFRDDRDDDVGASSSSSSSSSSSPADRVVRNGIDDDGPANKRNRANPPGEGTTNTTTNTTDQREDDGGGAGTWAAAGGGDVLRRCATTTERERIRRRAHDVMMEEFTCAMCMDVLVKSTFAYPCSHAFCSLCSMRITDAAATGVDARTSGNTKKTTRGKCPTCRGDVVEWMPARSYDTQVWSFALQGCFDVSDAMDYLERRASMGEDPPTEEERGSILNICAGVEGEDAKIRRTSVVGSVGAGNALQSYVTSRSAGQRTEMNKIIGTLPKMNSSAAMISNANNGMKVVDLAGYFRPVSHYSAKSADNDVICID